jgi:putative membrane protein
MMPTRTTERSPLPWILLVSGGIVTFLIWLIYFKGASEVGGEWVGTLPALNALLNALCASCLVAGFIHIRRGNRTVHMRFMLSAVVFSGMFFVSYVIYHHYHGDTPFPGQGMVRPVYFVVLISHIVLSIVAVPMVLSTVYYAAQQRFETHRKIARYTFPVWLYVSVTGVLVFLFLRAYA